MDLGSGDGIPTSTILSQYPQAHGVLVDFSQPMLAAAQEKLANYQNLTFLQLDYGDPAWIREVEKYIPFSLVVSGSSIHHQPDERKKELYLEIYNLLDWGGIFINTEHVASNSNLGRNLFDEYFIDSLHAWHKNQGVEKSPDEVAGEFYRREDKEANLLAPVEKQCRWLRNIGFADVDCFFKLFELAVFAGRKSMLPKRA